MNATRAKMELDWLFCVLVPQQPASHVSFLAIWLFPIKTMHSISFALFQCKGMLYFHSFLLSFLFTPRSFFTIQLFFSRLSLLPKQFWAGGRTHDWANKNSWKWDSLVERQWKFNKDYNDNLWQLRSIRFLGISFDNSPTLRIFKSTIISDLYNLTSIKSISTS